MISKLREQFILINMTIVVTIFIILFASLLIFTNHTNKTEAIASLERTLVMNTTSPQLIELDQRRESFFNSFTFLVSISYGHINVFLSQNTISLSQEVALMAVEKALASNQSSGVIRSLNLRFLIDDSTEDIRIAFIDMSHEIASRNHLIFIMLLAGTGGLIAFYFLSRYLAIWALRPVEEAWQQQQQFVADASHELKTPLTVILANLSILFTKPELTISSQEKWLKNTEYEALRMKTLVDDLLYLAKSDAQQVPLELKKIHYSDLVWNCILPFESVAYEHEVQIYPSIASDVYLLGDEHCLKQLLAILMDNACKYTPKQGAISVSLKESQHFVILEVNNTGNVIPETDLPNLFNRFYRVDASRTYQQGSYGLGLSIAQSIVNKHHGTIQVRSTKLDGTTFTVSFPVN